MGFTGEIRDAAKELLSHDEVTVISHIDADGISGESILAQALARAEIRVESVFVRQLEPLTMHRIPEDESFKVFCDLGSGQQNLLLEKGLRAEDVLILDHHVSQPCETDYRQVNSLPYGHTKLSAAGVAYLVAREMDPANVDLAPLAVIGNVGDMMAREDCGLVGPAADIAREGAEHGHIEIVKKDLNCYGTSTRPVHVCLAYNDDPYIPGISNNPNGALKFLQGLKIPLQTGTKRWRVWEELSLEEKRAIASMLIQHLVSRGEPVKRLFAESYLFPGETARTPLRNAQEFATLLNACGRWSRPRVGGMICRGDRGESYRQAEHMLSNHRAVIRDLLSYILDTGVKHLPHLQYIHVGDRYPDTIVGIGAGMALSKLDMGKPIMILVEQPEDPLVTKVSMRTNERTVARGIDLQQALTTASAEFGGAGGGHRIAAGAFIPKTSEEEFVHRVNELLGEQFASAGKNDC
ncbi:DHHA1 domain-containing protein [Methanolinea mesophila]|uniref:DHHA1 domain-containing protein n=1 Tax=Methanolinea mesophila TaxID=547055 RepID=UPI001AE76564|nr:DHH family phosphoesterase [Methanolinea mesophila]